MHDITAEEIKGDDVPRNRDVDPTRATSPSEAAGASSKHERAGIDHGKETSAGAPAQKSLAMEFITSHLKGQPDNTNLILVLWCARYKRLLLPVRVGDLSLVSLRAARNL